MSLSAIASLYCARCAPPDAEPIPNDLPFVVSRLELRVAIAGRPGDPVAAGDDAVRRVLYALEDVGALVVGIRIPGLKASTAAVTGDPLRLQLAGRPEPRVDPGSTLWEALSAPSCRRWWRGRQAG